MVDKPTRLIVEALGRAVGDPSGARLHGGKASPGLFPATAAGKQAAQRCLDLGYLRPVTDSPGKNGIEVCTITDKGLAYLLAEASPRQVLEDLVRAVEARQAQAGELTATARQMQASLDALRSSAEIVLRQVDRTSAPGGAEGMTATILEHLARWRDSGASGDCPLVELYRRMAPDNPSMTIGRFHDALRTLHDRGEVYLHPWTGPLYEIPEPAYALLVGHEVAYYASLRGAPPNGAAR